MRTHCSKDPFPAWLAALYARHTTRLRFAEIRRALQALSTIYVHQRNRLAAGEALNGAGKRAAFALFYTPLHALIVRHILDKLAPPRAAHIVDLGCGAGAAAAAWGLYQPAATVQGIDLSAWALEEARWNWHHLGLRGNAVRHTLEDWQPRQNPQAIVAAFALNELTPSTRARLLPQLMNAARHGSQVLVIEPIARSVVPWWEEWQQQVIDTGGTNQLWRFSAELPPELALLSRAAQLDHRQLTARSLYLPGHRQAGQPACSNALSSAPRLEGS